MADTDTHVIVSKEFLRSIVRVLDSKEMQSLFVLAHVHGCAYSGPHIDMRKLRMLAGLAEMPIDG